MGLDMYLTAHRSFIPNSPGAKRVLDAAGTSVDALKAMAARDPMVHDTTVYLPRWEHYGDSDETRRANAVMEAASLLPFATDGSGGSSLGWVDDAVRVSITCVYWRKANAIHAWFVEHCQGGVDECQEAVVSSEQLAFLRSTCIDALAAFETGDFAKAAEILTPRSGLFFGSTDIDEWWAEDLKHTVNEIERVVTLAASTRGGIAFTYQSSW